MSAERGDGKEAEPGREGQPRRRGATKLAASVRTARERRRAGGALLWVRTLAMVGSLGWLLAAPPIVGAFLGRALDRRAGAGIFWSATLIFVGAILGGWAVWRRLREGREGRK